MFGASGFEAVRHGLQLVHLALVGVHGEALVCGLGDRFRLRQDSLGLRLLAACLIGLRHGQQDPDAVTAAGPIVGGAHGLTDLGDLLAQQLRVAVVDRCLEEVGLQ